MDRRIELGDESFRVKKHETPVAAGRKETPPMLKIVETETEEQQTLDEIVRDGAQRMLQCALEVEVQAYLDQHRGERDEQCLRQRVTKGAGSRTKALVMAFKLLRWRRISAPDQLPLARAGATFVVGILRQPTQESRKDAA